MLLFFLFLTLGFAYDLVVVNSLDYGDLVNGLDYAILSNSSMLFIPHNYNYDILTLKIGTNRTIFYIEGNPISLAFRNYTLSSNNATFFQSNSSVATNHLFYQHFQPKKVVVANYYYPDYVVTLFPFAIHEGVFILLVDENVSALQQLLDSYPPEELYVFGPMSTQVQEYLAQKGAQVIGTLGEDRYQDNIALFDFYYNPERFNYMALVASGEEVEESMVTNASLPILLVGDLVPSVIYEKIKDLAKKGDLKGVYIFERKLVTPVYNMKKKLEEELRPILGEDWKFGLLLKYGEAIVSE
ncbi:MAG: hypothetical protein GXN92_00140, partial [Candidatus Micrarchaeota archaeon]|nr:hypothetical protein [Candidatus Micrarchaeota archaeon]